ncbi:MAG: hypothetical protein ACKVQJ_00380 [Pyrinomonadaceae bacterium]
MSNNQRVIRFLTVRLALPVFVLAGLIGFSTLSTSAQRAAANQRDGNAMRKPSDSVRTLAPLSTGGLVISEYFANPAGNDTNQEYVELVATKSINFAVTPYSVVFTNNGAATAAGWINGLALTYGFNINSGTVVAGDVVYVGGSGMAPAGTKLRAIDVTTTVSDPFAGGVTGNSALTAGVLGNGGANADGIAVFAAGLATLTNSSEPTDAIFFGTGAGTAVVNAGADGYQLPINDIYTGGKLQASSTILGDPTSGQVFIATGTFNSTSNTWTVARTWASQAAPGTAGTAVTLTGTTAADVSISGRVMTADGRGIRNARIVITGNSLARPRVAQVGPRGGYFFGNLESGQTYVVTVNSRLFTFSAPSQVVSLNDNVTGINFVADPRQ